MAMNHVSIMYLLLLCGCQLGLDNPFIETTIIRSGKYLRKSQLCTSTYNSLNLALLCNIILYCVKIGGM